MLCSSVPSSLRPDDAPLGECSDTGLVGPAPSKAVDHDRFWTYNGRHRSLRPRRDGPALNARPGGQEQGKSSIPAPRGEPICRPRFRSRFPSTRIEMTLNETPAPQPQSPSKGGFRVTPSPLNSQSHTTLLPVPMIRSVAPGMLSSNRRHSGSPLPLIAPTHGGHCHPNATRCYRMLHESKGSPFATRAFEKTWDTPAYGLCLEPICPSSRMMRCRSAFRGAPQFSTP